MTEGRIHVSQALLLQAEQASRFVSFAGQFLSSIKFIKEENVTNAKSILNILSMDLNPGEHIVVQVDGPDEQKTLSEVIQYINALN